MKFVHLVNEIILIFSSSDFMFISFVSGTIKLLFSLLTGNRVRPFLSLRIDGTTDYINAAYVTVSYLYIGVISHYFYGVSNHKQLACLFNSLFRMTANKSSRVPIIGHLWGKSPPLTRGSSQMTNDTYTRLWGIELTQVVSCIFPPPRETGRINSGKLCIMKKSSGTVVLKSCIACNRNFVWLLLECYYHNDRTSAHAKTC